MDHSLLEKMGRVRTAFKTVLEVGTVLAEVRSRFVDARQRYLKHVYSYIRLPKWCLAFVTKQWRCVL
jgi:hypothetical protein